MSSQQPPQGAANGSAPPHGYYPPPHQQTYHQHPYSGMQGPSDGSRPYADAHSYPPGQHAPGHNAPGFPQPYNAPHAPMIYHQQGPYRQGGNDGFNYPAPITPSGALGAGALGPPPRRSSLQDLLNPAPDAAPVSLPGPSPVPPMAVMPVAKPPIKKQRMLNTLGSATGPVPTHADKLPYDADALVWDEDRATNDKARYCYCGEDRNMLVADLYCLTCRNYFHRHCIAAELGEVVPFMFNYRFVCKNCSSTGAEEWQQSAASWRSAIATAMANVMVDKLRAAHPDWYKSRFDAKHSADVVFDGWLTRKRDIVPYLSDKRHWEALCGDRDITMNWQSILGTNIIREEGSFQAAKESARSSNSPYRLHDPNVFSKRPGLPVPPVRKREAKDYDVAGDDEDGPPREKKPKLRHVDGDIKPEVRTEVAEAKLDAVPEFTPGVPLPPGDDRILPQVFERPDSLKDKKSSTKKPLSTKRLDFHQTAAPAEERRITSVRIRPPPYKPRDFGAASRQPTRAAVEGNFAGGPYYAISDVPFNKRGFRYSACAAVPSLPSIMYTLADVDPAGPRLDWCDMSPYLYLSSDALRATTDKGFRMGRANVCMREGSWYWEVKVLRGNGDQGGHVRLGIARREASVEGPVGFDAYSYGIRDRGGEKVHLSRPRPFMQSFGTGDVIGFHLTLPPAPSPVPADAYPKPRAPAKGARKDGRPTIRPQLTNSGMQVIDDRPMDSSVVRDRIPIRFRQQLYFEQPEYVTTKEMDDLLNPNPLSAKPGDVNPADALAAVPKLKGSSLRIFVNGKPVKEAAFEDLWSFWPPNSYSNAPSGQPQSSTGGSPGAGAGSFADAMSGLTSAGGQRSQRDDGSLGYYPAVSCFNGGAVKLNFGPKFEKQPKGLDLSAVRPLYADRPAPAAATAATAAAAAAAKAADGSNATDAAATVDSNGDGAAKTKRMASTKGSARAVPAWRRYAEQVAEDFWHDLVDEVDFGTDLLAPSPSSQPAAASTPDNTAAGAAGAGAGAGAGAVEQRMKAHAADVRALRALAAENIDLARATRGPAALQASTSAVHIGSVSGAGSREGSRAQSPHAGRSTRHGNPAGVSSPAAAPVSPAVASSSVAATVGMSTRHGRSLENATSTGADAHDKTPAAMPSSANETVAAVGQAGEIVEYD